MTTKTTQAEINLDELANAYLRTLKNVLNSCECDLIEIDNFFYIEGLLHSALK